MTKRKLGLVDKILEFLLDIVGRFDLRLVALIVVNIGILFGIFASISILIITTLIIILISILFIQKSFREARESGGSETTGLFLMTMYGAVSFLLPMWIFSLIRYI